MFQQNLISPTGGPLCILAKHAWISWCKPEACSTMRAPGVLSNAFSLNASARQGACKRSLFKSIGVSAENQRWLPEQ